MPPNRAKIAIIAPGYAPVKKSAADIITEITIIPVLTFLKNPTIDSIPTIKAKI